MHMYVCVFSCFSNVWLLATLWTWRRQWHPTPVLLPGKSHGQRTLVGCSPWGPWESGMTEQLHFHCSLSCIGEGNDNPLQCSCLENPRDSGTWWAAASGVSQSWTRLKPLSSSSSSNTMDCSPPGSSAHRILQAGIVQWVAMPSSRGLSWPRDGTCISYIFCIGRRDLYC